MLRSAGDEVYARLELSHIASSSLLLPHLAVASHALLRVLSDKSDEYA